MALYLFISIVVSSIAFMILSEDPEITNNPSKERAARFAIFFFAILLWPLTLALTAAYFIYGAYVKLLKHKYISICLKVKNDRNEPIYSEEYYPISLTTRDRQLVDKINNIKDLKFLISIKKKKLDFIHIDDATIEYIKNRITDISFEKTILEDK